jgi:beta-galactosidase
LAADGEDLIPVEVDVLDAHGRIVPTADALVTFSVHGTGTVVGVGNGDPGDHDPDKADYRHAFNGKCMVLVGAAQRTGTIKLKATAAGLKPAMLELRSFAPAPSAAIRRS